MTKQDVLDQLAILIYDADQTQKLLDGFLGKLPAGEFYTNPAYDSLEQLLERIRRLIIQIRTAYGQLE